jgi:hypothetical protein
MKAYITQYALTQGILEMEGEVCDGGKVFAASLDGGSIVHSYFHRGHWHLTKKEAIYAAANMRGRKIASLKKQIQKLESLKFE